MCTLREASLVVHVQRGVVLWNPIIVVLYCVVLCCVVLLHVPMEDGPTRKEEKKGRGPWLDFGRE